MLTKVIFEGKLRKVLGLDHMMLEFGNISQMFGLLTANFPHLKQWFRENIQQYKYMECECSYQNGMKEKIDDTGMGLNRQCKEVRLTPLYTGAGGKAGVVQTILGAVITIIGIVMCCLECPYGANVVVMGIGMMLGGIITMMMAPSNDDEKDGGGTSYFFNGATNTTKQGLPVPLVFGRTLAGSAVISASIDVSSEEHPHGKHYFDDGSK